ncbi:unnamed protein product [Closterium sp. NIES-54]
MPLPVLPPPCAGDTLCEAAVKVLRTADPWMKADYGDLAAHLWATGAIRHAYVDRATLRDGSLSSGSAEARSAGSQGDADAGAAGSDEEQWLSVPDRPARDGTVRVVAARDMPRRGKGGSQQSRVALLHSLVHIESWAVDLAWVRARPTHGQGLGASPLPHSHGLHGLRQQYSHSSLPSLLRAPLLSTHHPPIPLAPAPAWQARGLDVVPQTIERFRAGGDSETAELLEQVVYPEEVTHCAAGARWFSFLCLRNLRARQGGEGGREEEAAGGGGGAGGTLRGEALGSEAAAVGRSESEDGDGDGKDEVKAERPGKAASEGLGGAAEQGMGEEEVSAEEHAAIVAEFHGIVRLHFRGKLKPPFNHEARAKAGLTRDWYEPLAE